MLAGEADGAECAILAGATPLWLRLDARTGFDTCLGGCVLRSWLTETSVAPRAQLLINLQAWGFRLR